MPSRLLPVGECGRRTSCLCNQSCSSWGSRAGERHHSGSSSVWNYSTWGFRNRARRTGRPCHRKMYWGTGEGEMEISPGETGNEEVRHIRTLWSIDDVVRCFIPHLVYEGTQRGEDVLQRHLWLRDLQEAQVNLEHLLHQWIVSHISTQLCLQRQGVNQGITSRVKTSSITRRLQVQDFL